MAKTPSHMIALGTPAPDFELIDVRNHQYITLRDGKAYQGTVILFICNHCPFVKHIQEALVALTKNYSASPIRFIAISSNDIVSHPDDAPDKMKAVANQFHYTFPYLYDETQAVAKTYQAACTPDIFLFGNDLTLVYRGQFDASTPGNRLPATGNRLSAAIDCLLLKLPIDFQQHPSIGCNIKWKAA